MRQQITNRNKSTVRIEQSNVSPMPVDPLKDRFLAVIEHIDIDVAYIRPSYVWRNSKWDKLDTPLSDAVLWRFPKPTLIIDELWVVYLELDRIDDEITSVLDKTTTTKDCIDQQPRFRVSIQHPPTPVLEVLMETEIASRSKDRQQRKPDMRPLQVTSAKLRLAENFVGERFDELEAIRRVYFENGKELEFTPQKEIYVGVPQQFVIGPVPLKRDETKGKWLIDCEYANVVVYQYFAKEICQALEINGSTRQIVRQQVPQLRELCIVDYRSDMLFSDALLADLGVPIENVDIIRKIVDNYSVSSTNILPYQSRRLLTLLETFVSDTSSKRRTITAILEFPEVIEMIDSHISSLRSDLEESMQEQLKVTSQQLIQLDMDISTKKQSLDILEARIDDIKVDREILLSANNAERLRQTETLVQSLLEEKTYKDQIPRVNNVFSKEIHNPVKPTTGIIEADENRAIRYFIKYLESAGINIDAGYTFLAAIMSKRTPIVIGTAAEQFLIGVSTYLFGGYALKRTVTPYMTEWSDLFGNVSPTRFRPDEDRLSDLVLTADPTKVHVVIFDGFNKCDADSVFSPLMSQNEHRLSILHPHSIALDSPYYQLGLVPWPDNFIPVFQYSHDGNRLPLRRWAESVTVMATFTEQQSRKVTPVFLTPSYIRDLQDSLMLYKNDVSPIINNLSQTTKDICFRFDTKLPEYMASLLSLGLPSTNIIDNVERSRVGAYLAISGIKCDENLSKIAQYSNNLLRDS